MLGNTNGDRPTRVALYARVSSEEQKEGDTIQMQLDTGRKYCETLGYELVVIYEDEAVSGTIPLQDRPGGALLLEAAADKQFDLALIYNIKRLARKLTVMMDAWEDLDQLGVGLIAVNDSIDTSTPMGRFMMQIMGSFAELDRETILETTRDGKEATVRRGFWPGGPPPMGYSIQHDNPTASQRRGYLVINEDEAKTIRLIYKMYLEDGMNIEKVTKYLNTHSVPTSTMMRKGKPSLWNVSRIQSILRHSVYSGSLVYYRRFNKKKREPVVGENPAIVAIEDWEAVQNRLTKNFASSRRNMKRLYLLRGLNRCGICGKACIGKGNRSRGRYYYECDDITKRTGQPECSGVRVRADMLEDRIWEDVKGFVLNPGEAAARLAAELDQDKDNSDEIESKTTEIFEAIGKARNQRRWIIDQGKRNIITTEEAASALTDTAQELEILESRQKDLEMQDRFRSAQHDYADNLEAMLSDLRDSVENADEETKHWALQLMVEKVMLTPMGKNRVRVEPYYRFNSLPKSAFVTSAPSHRGNKGTDLELPIFSFTYELRTGKGPRAAKWVK